MTFDAVWEKYIGEENDTMLPQYAEPVTIKCFQYGKTLWVARDMVQTAVSAKMYLTLVEISVKDRLDGQVVKAVEHWPESWDPRVILYGASTWADRFDQ